MASILGHVHTRNCEREQELSEKQDDARKEVSNLKFILKIFLVLPYPLKRLLLGSDLIDFNDGRCGIERGELSHRRLPKGTALSAGPCVGFALPQRKCYNFALAPINQHHPSFET